MSTRPIDADNHYYEPLDAFTRHLDKAFRKRGVRPLQEGKRVELVIGGKVNRFVPNPTFNPIIVPGCLDALFRGKIPDGVHPAEMMKVEPLRPEYRDRDARLAATDAQGLDAVLLFPTLGCGVEEALKHDVPATMASLSAFNRWLEEDWGFAYRDKLIGVPMLSLADPDAAVAERAPGATTRSGRGSRKRRSRPRSTSATAATTRSPRRGVRAPPSRASATPTP